MTVLFAVLMLCITASAAAAPEGFRYSKPLTDRAVKVGGNPKVTIHCARTLRVWWDTGWSDDSKYAAGRAFFNTREIHLPPNRCLPLERWLQGRRVDMPLLSAALFTFAHELGHAARLIRDELRADCYATAKYNAVARAFGVKSARTLQRLRNDAPLLPPAADLC